MNMIELFQKGNQELFHSSFIAWLLNQKGEHGFGNRFAERLLGKINYETGHDYNVYTESRDRNSRFDIVIEPGQEGILPLVIENKVKSFGNQAQIQGYKEHGYKVAFLAFLKETIEGVDESDVIYYQDVVDALNAEDLIESNHYHFLIHEYKQYLLLPPALYQPKFSNYSSPYTLIQPNSVQINPAISPLT